MTCCACGHAHRELDLSNYMKAPDQPAPTYDLVAVTDHSGEMYCEGEGGYSVKEEES